MSTLINRFATLKIRRPLRRVTQADIRRAQIELLRWLIEQETGLTTVEVLSCR